MIALNGDLVLGLGFTAVGGYTLVAGFRELARAIDSEDWPAVPGEIEETGILSDTSGKYITFAPEVRYHYKVGDSQYVSDRIAFGGTVSMSFRSWAAGIVARYRKAKSVTVRVCPTNPDLAVLEPGAHWSSWLILIMAAGFAGYGIRSLLLYFGILG